jgi:hypothetical protein
MGQIQQLKTGIIHQAITRIWLPQRYMPNLSFCPTARGQQCLLMEWSGRFPATLVIEIRLRGGKDKEHAKLTK